MFGAGLLFGPGLVLPLLGTGSRLPREGVGLLGRLEAYPTLHLRFQLRHPLLQLADGRLAVLHRPVPTVPLLGVHDLGHRYDAVAGADPTRRHHGQLVRDLAGIAQQGHLAALRLVAFFAARLVGHGLLVPLGAGDFPRHDFFHRDRPQRAAIIAEGPPLQMLQQRLVPMQGQTELLRRHKLPPVLRQRRGHPLLHPPNPPVHRRLRAPQLLGNPLLRQPRHPQLVSPLIPPARHLGKLRPDLRLTHVLGLFPAVFCIRGHGIAPGKENGLQNSRSHALRGNEGSYNIQLFTTTVVTVKASAKDFHKLCNCQPHKDLAATFASLPAAQRPRYAAPSFFFQEFA